jgi:hypothetical protein
MIVYNVHLWHFTNIRMQNIKQEGTEGRYVRRGTEECIFLYI